MMSFRNVLLAIASALLLSACGASAGTAPVAGAPARASGADTAPSYKIYIANAGNNTITTYTSEGTQTSPTIQTGTGLNRLPFRHGSRFERQDLRSQLRSPPRARYERHRDDLQAGWVPTTPTITIKEHGYSGPTGLAVDANGKIYVVSSTQNGSAGIVTTYNRDGRRTTPHSRCWARLQ